MADVLAMLDACASGHTRRVGNHRLVITYRGQTFMGLPKGPGRGHSLDSVVVPYSKIRKAVRMLGIAEDCARPYFPDL